MHVHESQPKAFQNQILHLTGSFSAYWNPAEWPAVHCGLGRVSEQLWGLPSWSFYLRGRESLHNSKLFKMYKQGIWFNSGQSWSRLHLEMLKLCIKDLPDVYSREWLRNSMTRTASWTSKVFPHVRCVHFLLILPALLNWVCGPLMGTLRRL